MEQKLNMNLSQHLAMTMKLRQAIQILQLSAQDLRAAIEKEYLENPALEIEYDKADLVGPLDKHSDPYRAEDISALADYLGGDSQEPHYFTDDIDRGLEAAAPVDITLEDELLEQVNFLFRDEAEKAIAVFIVGCIDSRGYLALPVEEIARAMQASEEAVLSVLERIQELEPAGVGARSLAECLRIQAEQQGIYEGLVAALIDHHLDEVAQGRIKAIAEAEKVGPEDVQMAVDILRTLNPKPGSAYGGETSNYITPDVLVQKLDGGYRVTMNDSYVPHLHISALYREAAGFDEETQKYISQRLSSAFWLIKSIEQRRVTICHVVEEIVRRQQEALEQGMNHLKPMTMKEVADSIGVHESTVSRAVANKFAEFPLGVVALKKFFTVNLAASSEEEFIADQVRAAMEEIIRSEDARKPYSDQKITALLAERGMKLSRRTVMKYREQLGIPSSVKRKRY